MTATALLAHLRTMGARMIIRDGSIVVDAPVGVITEQVRSDLIATKRELLDLIQNTNQPAASAAKTRATPAVTARALDPRPDLTDDAPAWHRLLSAAHRLHGDRDGVCGALRGMRCLGVHLSTNAVGTLRLEPRAYVPGRPPGWTVTQEEYRVERDRWLTPHRAEVIALLAAAATDEGPD